MKEQFNEKEDLFYYIREYEPQNINYSALSDLIFEGIDFIKLELEKIKNGDNPEGEFSSLIENIKQFLSKLKHHHIKTGKKWRVGRMYFIGGWKYKSYS